MSEQITSEKFIPVFFVDEIKLNHEFESGDWPLHMSYFPPLKAPYNVAHTQILRELINPMAPFEATVGKDDFFGENYDIEVKLLERSLPLQAVHQAIISALEQVPHDARYRTLYNPHVTVAHNNPRINTGDVLHMGGLSIVEKIPATGTWKVSAKVGLKGGIE